MNKKSFLKYLFFSDLLLIIWGKCKFFSIICLRWVILLFSKNKRITPVSFFISNKKLFSGQLAELDFEFENVLYYILEINQGKNLFYTKHDISELDPEFVIVENVDELEGDTWHLIGTKFKTVETNFTFLNKLSNNDSLKLTIIGFGSNILFQKFDFNSKEELSFNTNKLNINEVALYHSNNRELKISSGLKEFSFPFVRIKLNETSSKFINRPIRIAKIFNTKIKFNKFIKTDYL